MARHTRIAPTGSFLRAGACAVVLAAAAALPASAAVRRLQVEGEDWVCHYAAFRTHAPDRLVLDVCGMQRELFDWGHGFAPLPADVRGVSADGRWAVGSDARSDSSQVFLYDLQTGTSARVTATEFGLPSTGRSSGAMLTADGERVLFTSFAADLLPAGSGTVAVLEWRRADRRIALRAANAQLRGASADGEVLVVYDAVVTQPAFALLDRATGARETYCVPGASVCEFLGLSPDGRWLAYAHAQSGEPAARVLHDRVSGLSSALGGFERGRGSVAFDHASSQVAYDAPLDADPARHGLRVRELASGAERAVAFDRPVTWQVAPVAFGPERQLAVYDDTVVIVSLDTIFAQGFD